MLETNPSVFCDKCVEDFLDSNFPDSENRKALLPETIVALKVVSQKWTNVSGPTVIRARPCLPSSLFPAWFLLSKKNLVLTNIWLENINTIISPNKAEI